MADWRRRRGPRRFTGGNVQNAPEEGVPWGYWNERDAAMEKADVEALRSFLPHNFEAESALLGALMISNPLIEDIGSRLDPDDFFDPLHGRIFEAILAQNARGTAPNPLTIYPYFEGEVMAYRDEKGVEQQLPIKQYLAQLTGSGAGLIGARDFAKQIVEFAACRRLMAGAVAMLDVFEDRETRIDVRAAMATLEESMIEVSEHLDRGRTRGPRMFADSWDETIEEINTASAGKEGGPGFKIVGYVDWNDVCGAMEAEDYILLGGRPGMGKTALSCSVAIGAALAGHATEYLSLEMPRRKITRRMIATTIFHHYKTSNYAQMQRGAWTSEDLASLKAARQAIADAPMSIDDPDDFFVEDLKGWIRRRQRAWTRRGQPLKLVIIDYLAKISTRRSFQKEADRVGYISNEIKKAAKATGVAIIVLVQLSRGVDARDDKRPVLTDLRDSGTLEQDADVVVFVYRDEYYLERSEPPKANVNKHNAWTDDLAAARDRIEVYSAKRREGGLAKRTGYFYAKEQALRPSTFFAPGTMFSPQGGINDFIDLVERELEGQWTGEQERL